MFGLRHRHRILLAVLLGAGVMCGCKKEDDFSEGPPAQLGGRLQPGIEVSIRMWGEASEYVFDAKAGQVISLSVTSGIPGLDPLVRLIAPSGAEEAFDDDSGANGNAAILEHLLASDGTYTVKIETDENQPGEVSVLLSLAGAVEGTPIPLGTDLP